MTGDPFILPPTPSEPDRTDEPADRGVSPVADRFGGNRGRVATLAAVGIGCAVFLFATWDRGDARGAPDDGETQEAVRQIAPFEPARRDRPPPRLENASTDLLADPAGNDPFALPPEPSASAPAGPSPAEQRAAVLESARRAPVLAWSRPPASNAAPVLPPAVRAPDGEPTPLRRLSAATPVGAVAAGRLPDRRFLLTAGTVVPCVLQTAMDSTTPGHVSCLVSRDVWSDDGAVVLLDRGTRVLGEYQGGLQPGRRRLFVLWTRAVTPGGVTVALAFPASDALGRGGFDGAVDTHFRERFGGALLLSIVDDAVRIAADAGDDLRAVTRAPSDAAGIALQGSIGIPSTLRRPQGSEVTIFVAHDLDFSGVYGLRPR